jgi:hypothetical protein
VTSVRAVRRRLCDRCGRWYRVKAIHDGLGEVCLSCRPGSPASEVRIPEKVRPDNG